MPQIIWKAGLLKDGQARLHNSNKETQHKKNNLDGDELNNILAVLPLNTKC